LAAFYRANGAAASRVVVMSGEVERLRHRIFDTSATKRLDAAQITVDRERLAEKTLEQLKRVFADVTKLKISQIDAQEPLESYGIDSIMIVRLNHELANVFGELPNISPALFFSHRTLAQLTDYFVQAKAAGMEVFYRQPAAEPASARGSGQDRIATPLLKRLQHRRSKPLSGTRLNPDAAEPIAIIGMSGRFPGAADMAAFWRNLVEGRDCISEVPPERWDWRQYHGDPNQEPNKANVKWGGFIDGVEEFDPLFFEISPREAGLMDPQQRLLMMYVWNAIEDAGYSATSLSGSHTALLVGMGGSGYAGLLAQAQVAIGEYSATGLVPSVGPNRMSYFLDLHGPSEPIETACSSSLVALHRAMQALACGSCEMAIAGGINTVLTPEPSVSLSKMGMLSEDGRCKAFSAHANGYVRAEGIGILVLKKLEAAEEAGDHIYGVIRGSAQNHGGRAQSLTAPNPKAQAELLKAAYLRAGVDPRSVSYIETHGSGTILGDSIEIHSLKDAFKELAEAQGTALGTAYCGLGSVKTNIGNLELAGGVAGVIKVLLQLQYKTLVKSLHCEEINPYLQLEGSPFYIVQETRPWEPMFDTQNRALPRRAGVSSFGLGGVNMHLVIEEYVPPVDVERRSVVVSELQPALIVLSAKNEERLRERAEQLL
ncbi:beta-ketoacyl synthase N-terminal-like domain-containing protein, partial [Bradyrhizobium sp. SZCCHNRI2049]|uniref:beta-ketoacyl synthase N-terminal-like domain-containing protein n=1 Tax=Bradyrhizobium sp. SZCCHNRI2049 TaxID=3057287 RepID=UPI0029162634